MVSINQRDMLCGVLTVTRSQRTDGGEGKTEYRDTFKKLFLTNQSPENKALPDSVARQNTAH